MLKKCSFFTKSEKYIKLKNTIFNMDLISNNLPLIISSLFSSFVVLAGVYLLFHVSKQKINKHVNSFEDNLLSAFGIKSSSAIARQRGLKSAKVRQSKMVSREILDGIFDSIEKQFPLLGLADTALDAVGFDYNIVKTVKKMAKKNPEATLAYIQQNPDFIMNLMNTFKSATGQTGKIPSANDQPQDFIGSLFGGLNPVATSPSQTTQPKPPAFNTGLAGLKSSKKTVSVK